MSLVDLLPDRQVESWSCYEAAVSSGTQANTRQLLLSDVVVNGQVDHLADRIQVRYCGDAGTYQFTLKLNTPFFGNGVGARFRLNGWDSLRYVAIGYTDKGSFRHVKIPNAAGDTWVDFSVGHPDLAFGLQNNWECPEATEITDIRIYLSGTPGDDGAFLDVASCWCFHELETPPDWVVCVSNVPRVSAPLLNVVYSYLKKCFRTADTQAKAFLEEGRCPLYGEICLDWLSSEPLPANLSDITTYRFSWHALHPATILMIQARETGDVAPLFAAREMVTNWLDRSYFQADTDKKFTWYDHGTAERLLSLVLMWAIGLEYKFDHRFMVRLRNAIFRHGQLLASDVFYASHQPTRYHNHAWFQDLALMATSLAMPDFPCSLSWMETAIIRLTDQLGRLVVRDNGYAVFVENSIGYHHGVQRLVEFAGELVRLTNKETLISTVANELPLFSAFLRYPDNRAPAQGDTFRRSNATGAEIRRLSPYLEPVCIVLPKAGYAVVKGNHDGCRFMLTMLATSVCRTHKHEDNLSITLFFDGLEWLIDPSFYSHEYSAPIPAYLRSAAAHNALSMPEHSYSLTPGIAELDGVVQEGRFVIQGRHLAYDDVRIERKISGQLDCLDFTVVDRAFLLSKNSHGDDLQLMFHCGEQVNARVSGQTLLLSHPDSRYTVEISLPSDTIHIDYGQEEGPTVCGVTGLGFMQTAAIYTVACTVPADADLFWRLHVAGE